MVSRLNKFAAVIAAAVLSPACIVGDSPDTSVGVARPKAGLQEQYMYIVAINRGGSADSDMVFVVNTDPGDPDFGEIVHRTDLPTAGDEVHHFNYSWDKQRLIVPGLFSQNVHILDLSNPHKPEVTVTNAGLPNSGYIVPHTVIPLEDGVALFTMIGSTTATTGPGGMVLVNDRTGEFIDYYGPGPNRTAEDLGPKYMYDWSPGTHVNRAISTTFGYPADLAGGINPAGLGDEVAVWDFNARKVIQTVNLGANSGCLEARWIEQGTTIGYVNCPGTGAVWLWEDEDYDGVYEFHQVLGPNDGLVLPVDMLLSEDKRYMYITNWAGNTVQQFDITTPFHPTLVGTASVPHPNMVRLTPDGKRLYVTNQLLSTWDDDPALGGPRNTDYGIWLFDVNTDTGGLTSATADGSAWVDFDAVQKKSGIGPAGPHMMLFDPAVQTVFGHH